MANDISETVLASTCASLLSRTVCHPIDTLKARLQVHGSVARFGRSPAQILLTLVKSEGIAGLYRGFGSVALVGTPAGMLYLTTYETLNRMRHASFGWHFACGLTAEAVACLLFVPVDVIKERVQVASASTSWRCAIDVARHEGPLALYRGYGPTVFSFGIYSGLYFAFYERIKTPNDTFVESLLRAGFASSAASWLTSPLDLAKLRLQVQGNGRFLDILIDAAKSEGLSGLFRGAGARVAFFAPSTAICMATFETFKRHFNTM